jgi:hypothetical protein
MTATGSNIQHLVEEKACHTVRHLFMLASFHFVSGCSSGVGGSADIVGTPAKSLGISPTPAVGSFGAILGLAKEKLGDGDTVGNLLKGALK